MTDKPAKRQTLAQHRKRVMHKIDKQHLSAQAALTLICDHLSALSKAVDELLYREQQRTRRNVSRLAP